MDLRRLRAGEWIAAGAGVLTVVALFLPWYAVAGQSASGWEALAAIDVILAILAVAAIGLWPFAVHRATALNAVAYASLMVVPALVGVLLALIRTLSVPTAFEDREPGLWLALAGTLGILAGVLVSQRDERLSGDGPPTDHTGVPAQAPDIETLPSPPAGGAHT